MKLSERIYNLRKDSGMTQDDLASACGVSRQSVSKWETGESKPDINSVISIAKTFNMSIDELVGLSEKNKDKKNPKNPFVYVCVIAVVLVSAVLISSVLAYNFAKNSGPFLNDDLKEVHVIVEEGKKNLLHIEAKPKVFDESANMYLEFASINGTCYSEAMQAHYNDKKYVYEDLFYNNEFTDVYIVLKRGNKSKKILIVDNLNCSGVNRNLRVGLKNAETFKLKNLKDWVQDI